MVSVLQRHGAMSRADLQRHVRLSRATISSIVSTLTTAQVIIQLPAPLGERGRGRPVGLLSLNPLSSVGTRSGWTWHTVTLPWR